MDGDKSLVIKDRTLTTVAKRNMEGIVPLSYPLRKAKGGTLSNDSLYEGMINAYIGGNIGVVSNKITKIWNCGEEIDEQELKVVKQLCFENNAVIDFAKCLWKPTRPTKVDEIIKSYTKAQVPYFFQYAKDKEPAQCEPINNSTMNRISQRIPTGKIKYCKTIGKFDYRMLMDMTMGLDLNEDSPIIQSYDYYNNHQYLFNNPSEDTHLPQDDLYVYRLIRQKILDDNSAYDVNYIVNTLVSYLYTVKKTSSKKILWASFGGEIVDNLKLNTVGLGNICPNCGTRFHKKQVCCSAKCSKEFYERNFRK